jgi:hypothetical protein
MIIIFYQLKTFVWVGGGRHRAETRFVLPPPSNFSRVEAKNSGINKQKEDMIAVA